MIYVQPIVNIFTPSVSFTPVHVVAREHGTRVHPSRNLPCPVHRVGDVNWGCGVFLAFVTWGLCHRQHQHQDTKGVDGVMSLGVIGLDDGVDIVSVTMCVPRPLR